MRRAERERREAYKEGRRIGRDDGFSVGLDLGYLRGKSEGMTKKEKKELSEKAIRVYEHEVISAIEEHMDPQGDDAHHIQVALQNAAHIMRGEGTTDGRTPTPCPECAMTYGTHKFDCGQGPQTLNSLFVEKRRGKNESRQNKTGKEKDQ